MTPQNCSTGYSVNALMLSLWVSGFQGGWHHSQASPFSFSSYRCNMCIEHVRVWCYCRRERKSLTERKQRTKSRRWGWWTLVWPQSSWKTALVNMWTSWSFWSRDTPECEFWLKSGFSSFNGCALEIIKTCHANVAYSCWMQLAVLCLIIVLIFFFFCMVLWKHGCASCEAWLPLMLSNPHCSSLLHCQYQNVSYCMCIYIYATISLW